MLKNACHAATVGALASLFVSTAAIGAKSRPIEIGSQPITSALGEFVQQSGLQVLFPADESINSVVAPSVRGALTPESALSQLLASSGLSYEFVNPYTVAIRVAVLNRATTDDAREAAAPAEQTSRDSQRDESTGTVSEVGGVPEVLVKGRSLNADIARSEDDIQPYVVIGRKEIERSGAKNVEDLLRSRLTMSYVPLSNEQKVEGGSKSTVSLRGLAAEQTLILINGRRTSVGGFFGNLVQPDLNGIPLSAIERIEVLPATASGIYGGGATGGVVNVILRHDYSGVEATVAYEDSFRGGGAQRRLDLAGGFAFNGGKSSLTFNGSYSDRNQLIVGERSFYADYARRRDANQFTYSSEAYLRSGLPPLGATTNISSVAQLDFSIFPACLGDPPDFSKFINCFTTPNLSFKPAYGGNTLGTPITSVPANCTGVASSCLPGFLQNSGRYNADLADADQPGARNASLLNDPEVQSLSMTLQHSFTPRLDGYLDLAASRNYGHFSQLLFISNFDIPSSSPNNPFDQDIKVNIPVHLSGADAVQKNKTSHALAGLKFGLPNEWGGAVEYSFDRVDLTQSSPGFVSSAADDAIASGTLDVLVAPPPGGFDLSAYAIPSADTLPSHAILKSASARVGGTAFTLPAGPVLLTAVLEYDQQSFSEFTQVTFDETQTPSVTRYSEQASTTKSLYSEAQVPIVSETMGIPALRNVSLQVANRLESYRYIGGLQIEDEASFDPSVRPRLRFHSSDPTFGVRVQPWKSVTFRASYGKGFFPPGLSQLQPAPPAVVFASILTDPKRGNQPLGDVLVASGGSTNLRPERSKSHSFGVILTPPIDQLRFSFDWTRIRKQDNIAQLSLQQTSIDDEDLLPGIVQRSTDPSTFDGFGVGPIVGFNGALINATRALSESYDIAGSYLRQTERYGTFELYANATRLIQNQRQLVPAGPTDNFVGAFSAPSWQANATLAWTWRSFGATWFTRYLDSVWVTDDHRFSAAQGDDRLANAMYHDVAFQYRFGDAAARNSTFFGGSVQIGIKNVFDRRPRFVGGSSFLYDTSMSPMLATYYVSLTARF